MSRNPLLRFWFNLLFWSFGRGTWQYDILCGSIIAFLLLTPTPWFYSGVEHLPADARLRPVSLQKINTNTYLLLAADPDAPSINSELEKSWNDFDRRMNHRFTRKAFYDPQGQKLGYLLSAP